VVSRNTGGCGRPPRPILSSRTRNGIHLPVAVEVAGGDGQVELVCSTSATGVGCLRVFRHLGGNT
jgi:hypothetical protein